MKNKTRNIFCVLLGIMALSLFNSCETTNLDLQDNPNELTVDSADPGFVLNSIIGTFGQQHFTFSAIAEPMIRHNHLFGTYANSAGTNTMNGVWQQTYTIANNLKFLKGISETKNLPQHVGVGQIIEAYAYVNLVDYIGTAVYSEAVNTDIENPKLDAGADIYNAMYAQLDEAVVNLSQEGSLILEDFFFNGDTEKWIKLANTLKLRMYVQSKLVATPDMVANLNAIVASGNFISDPEDDFVVQFGTSVINPDNRHTYFQQQYASGNNAGNVFQSNDFMNLLLNTKSEPDPRTPYYFYRQDLNNPPADDFDHCDANFDYCYLGGGYDGRDHGDDEGIENDGEQRVAYGIYPGGGAFDEAGTQTEETAIANSTFVYDPSLDTGEEDGLTEAEQLALHIRTHLSTVNPDTRNSTNNRGEGIGPFLTASFVHFLLAEAALPAPSGMGANGDSAALLQTAMELSFDKVGEVSGIPISSSAITNYVGEVMAEFNGAGDEAKLEIIAREFYIASIGNSVEAYNLYRRTGYPNLEAHVLSSGGDFPRSYFIPSSEIDTNSNVNDQKLLTDQVFWDTNAAGFID